MQKTCPTLRDFGVQNLVTSKDKTSNTNNSRNCEKECAGFWGSELREFHCPNININNFPKCEKERVRPAFQDFGVSWFS
jgi:hypothetical protein